MKYKLDTVIIARLMNENDQSNVTPQDAMTFEHELSELSRNINFITHLQSEIAGNPEVLALVQGFISRTNLSISQLIDDLLERP